MFWCLPDNSKCEWRKLEYFVKQYNKISEANYTLAECLDVFDSKKPQPEIKLKAFGKKDIVIEHKIITWPPNYLKLHRAQHDLIDCFIEKIRAEFQDDLYVLEILSDDIVPKKRTIQEWANTIAKIVINNRDRIRITGGICSSNPIRWFFKRLPDCERDDNVPQQGVGVYVNGPFDEISIDNFESESRKIKDGVKDILVSHLEKASVKFTNYNNCIRIFITEVYGEHPLLSHELIEKILPSINQPSNIDQIWVGYPRWTIENDYEKVYKILSK
ncbi:hypothetical protein DENIS_0117 [Desulfonema ishimotonii]|uniref:Uncharacterized protein n=1 Tax=Desulfonema ishimotonii TaxID=45657 RepID=A0A401FQC6_9BACT|nr:hypothetical protein [Desulfonema ishimotonii]GBC59181.1 hypothetical protein DENIS_0117 [Desulfonema ishimotonii]